MSGYDEKDTTSLKLDSTKIHNNINESLEHLKIGIVNEFKQNDLSADSQKLFSNAISEFESLGAKISEISLPNIAQSVPTYYVVAPAECSSNLSRYDGVKYGYRSSNADDLESLYVNSRSEGFGEEVKRRILIGTYVLSSGYYLSLIHI